MRTATARQLEALGIIAREPGVSIRELGDRMSIRSLNAIRQMVGALEVKGLVRTEPMKSRAIRPTAKGLALVGYGLGVAQTIEVGEVAETATAWNPERAEPRGGAFLAMLAERKLRVVSI